MREPSGEAQQLVDSPMLNEILDQLEGDAIEAAIYAKPGQDDERRISLQEVQAIRSLRRKLRTLAEGATKPAKRGSVA